jgi:hypothetical protein
MSIPEDWARVPRQGHIVRRLDVTLRGEGRLNAATLAQICIEMLAVTGLRETDPASGSRPKEAVPYGPEANAVGEGAFPAKVHDSREVIWVQTEGRRTEQEYKRIEVLDTQLATDTAIIAAMTSLEAKEVRLEGLEDRFIRSAIIGSMPHPAADETSDEELSQMPSDGPEALQDEKDHAERVPDWWAPQFIEYWQSIDYVVALLRHFRPEFDELESDAQLALVRDGCRRMNAYLQALRQLTTFLEYGRPDKDLRLTLKSVERDIRAAELQDIEGLSSVKVGRVLGIEPPPSDQFKRTNSRALNMAKRGRQILVDALGQDGWQKLAESKRAEREYFSSLAIEEQNLIRFAEAENMSVEDARRLGENIDPNVDEYVRNLIEAVIADIDQNEFDRRNAGEA